MNYLFDNSLPPGIARGLREFGLQVQHVAEVEELGRDAKDPDILQYCGQHDTIFVSEDKRLRYNPDEITAIRRHRAGAFILQGKEMSAWQRVLQIVKAWEEMERKAKATHRPFVFKVTRHGKVHKKPESL